MLNWRTIRQGLLRLRTAQRRETDGKPWSQGDLAKKSGVDKATIFRIENVAQEYKPDLQTIQQLLTAMTGQRLSEFFAELEAGERSDAVPRQTPQQQRRQAEDVEARLRADYDVVAIANHFIAALDRLNASIERLDQIIGGVAERSPRPHRSVASRRS